MSPWALPQLQAPNLSTSPQAENVVANQPRWFFGPSAQPVVGNGTGQ
jgi:hypothetical protein